MFISGANRGLGLEFARQYAADGWSVIAACRDPARSGALADIPDIEIVALEAADSASVAACAASLGERTIDLLINNAGIFGSTVGDEEQSLARMNPDVWLDVLRINVIAPFELTRALLPRLREGGIVAIMSSELGSIAENSFGDMYGYRSSKAAVNMVGRCLSIDLRPRGIAVVLLHPGWASTDMGGPAAPVNPVDSIAGLRGVLSGVTLESTGRFLAWDGRELPW